MTNNEQMAKDAHELHELSHKIKELEARAEALKLRFRKSIPTGGWQVFGSIIVFVDMLQQGRTGTRYSKVTTRAQV